MIIYLVVNNLSSDEKSLKDHTHKIKMNKAKKNCWLLNRMT